MVGERRHGRGHPDQKRFLTGRRTDGSAGDPGKRVGNRQGLVELEALDATVSEKALEAGHPRREVDVAHPASEVHQARHPALPPEGVSALAGEYPREPALDEVLPRLDLVVTHWAPAILEGVLYFAAGIWPTDGIYICALQADSGKVLWCNDSAGAIEMPQPHPTARAKSGVAAQGYLAIAEDQPVDSLRS